MELLLKGEKKTVRMTPRPPPSPDKDAMEAFPEGLRFVFQKELAQKDHWQKRMQPKGCMPKGLRPKGPKRTGAKRHKRRKLT